MARICKNEKGWNWNIGTCTHRDRESSINFSFRALQKHHPKQTSVHYALCSSKKKY